METSLLANIATAIFFAGGLVYAVKTMGNRLTKLEEKMDSMAALMVTQGRHEERLIAMDQRILSQGKRLDEALKTHAESLQQMGRMVEATISRVNVIADRRIGDRDGS